MSENPVSTDPTLTDQSQANRAGKKRGAVIGIIVAVVVVLLAGGITAYALTRDDNDEPTAAASGDPDPTRTLAVAVQLLPTNLDLRTTAGAALEQVLIDNVYQGLVTRNPRGEILPSIAQSWDISADALTYTFTLYPSITFSNGDALTAQDVAWSINELISQQYRDYTALSHVDTITADGDSTVVIKLKTPDPTLLYNLGGRSGLVYDQDASYQPASEAIGSGPFVLTNFLAGAHVTLTWNRHYWGPKPKVATVAFRLFSDTNAIVNAVNDGTVDVAVIDPNLRSLVDGNSNYDIIEGFASDKFTLAFNNQKAPFTDVRVRQAIRYGIDHQAVVTAIGAGKTLYGPIVDSDPGYEDLSSLYPYDPDKAKQLLADAGFGSGLNLTLTIASFYGATIPDLLTSQLAEIGITLTVESVDFATWLSKVYTNHDYDLSIVDHAEARDFQNWANPNYYFGYDNAQVQELYQQATSALSDTEYADKLRQAARIVSQDAAADWLFNPVPYVAVRKGLTGVPTSSTSSRFNATQAEFTQA